MSLPKAGVGQWVVHLDPPHYMDRDCDPRGSRVVPLRERLSDGDLHYRVGGNDHACRSQPSRRQTRVGSAFSRRSGDFHTIPARSVLPRIRLHIRPGDSGTVRGFAIAAQKIVHAESRNPAASKIVIHLADL